MKLTSQQTEIIKGVALGKPAKCIASELGMTMKALDYQLSQARNTIGVRPIALVTHYAIAKKLVPLAFCLFLMTAQAQKGATLLMKPSGVIRTLPTLVLLPPTGENVTLTWDSTNTSFRIYSSTNKINWFLINTITGTTVTVTNIPLTNYFFVTAIIGTNESLPSNTLGLLGKTSTNSIYWQTSPDLAIWTERGLITNEEVTAISGYFRLRIANTNRWRTVITP